MMPVATSTYTVLRPVDADADSGDPADYQPVYTEVPGNTVYFSGTESVVGGSRERVDARVMMDNSADVKSYDHLLDEVTGDRWEVSFARRRTGLGLDHLVIGVYQVTGVARGTRDL